MVEKLLTSKQGATQDLASLASEMLGFNKRLEAYTTSKCIYSRSMDTCVVEMLYWTNQTRQIMNQTKMCFEECDVAQDPNACKMTCMKEARAQYAEVQDMTEQMIAVSRQELNESKDN